MARGHKLIIKDYTFPVAYKKKDGSIEEKEEPYKIREALGNIMLSPSLKHQGYRFHTVSKVVDKIEACKKDVIVLDAKDFDIVKESFDKFEGYGKHDKELINRVYEAEEVELKESKK